MIFRIGNKQRIANSDKRLVGKEKLTAKRFTLNANKGLTLIEILLAVSILGVGLVGVSRGYGSAIVTLEAGQFNIDAVNLLREKMGEIEVELAEKEEITQESRQGSFEGFFEDFLWKYEIKSIGTEDLNLLTVEVSHKINPRKYALNTYVANKKSEEEDE